jgi:hypothetical protein
MTKYRKKQIAVEAIQWDGDNRDDVAEFLDLDMDIDWEYFDPNNRDVYIKTLEGIMKATIGDYIVKGVNGEFYPVKEDIFLKTYEKVEEVE